MDKNLVFASKIIFVIVMCSFSVYFFSPFMSEVVIITTLDSLQNLAAAVFTLCGIWIAVIYPEAIKSYTSTNVTLVKGSESAKRIEHLILSVSYSALVLLMILISNITFQPLVEIFVGKIKYIKSIYLFFFFYALILQTSVMVDLLLNGFKFANDIHQRNIDTQIEND